MYDNHTGALEGPERPHASDSTDQRVLADGGVQWGDLSSFQRDTLEAIRRLERDDETSYGLAIKRRLESEYGEEVNHGRLYPNLDDLVEFGLVEKSALDRRTNEVVLTDEGRALLLQRVERLANACEMQMAATDGGEEEADKPDGLEGGESA